jgi:hypothetical protein
MIADLLMGHLVGDYLLQDDWQAQNKKKPSPLGDIACAVHSIIYTLCVWAFTWLGGNLWPAWALAIIYVTHFCLDRWKFMPWWFKMANKPIFGAPPMAPWSYIVVDNIFHILVLYILWKVV